METETEKSAVSLKDMSPVTLFQAVTASSSVTTPIIRVHSGTNHSLFVHYTEQTHSMMFHWLNVNPNTTNYRTIQYGWHTVQFATKIVCEAFNFTMVRLSTLSLQFYHDTLVYLDNAKYLWPLID